MIMIIFMILVNITSAKAHLSSLLKQLEENNEEIIIERAGKPIAKILKYRAIKKFNRLGILKNKIHVSDDFDQWPNDIAITLGIKD
jgi:antitoxin (DNA-binding transcriptional repressor) of toxin-antitoxin stability system